MAEYEGQVGEVKDILDTQTRALLDNRFQINDLDQIFSGLLNIQAAVKSKIAPAEGIFAEYKLLADVLPDRVPYDVTEFIFNHISSDPRAKFALSHLHAKVIIGVIERKEVPLEQRDEAMQEALIGLVNGTFDEYIGPFDGRKFNNFLSGKIETLIKPFLGDFSEEDGIESFTARRRRETATASDPLERVIAAIDIQELNDLLQATLTATQQEILVRRFFMGETLKDIGAQMGMTYKAVGRAEDILLEQIREAVRARDKAERAEAILPIPEGLWKGVVAACGFAVGSYQFRTRLSALARRFPLFEDRIAVLANAKASIDPTRYSAATYLRDMPEGIKLLLDRIILSRDPQGSSGGRNLDYEAEIREALTSIGIYDIYGAAVANITVREIVQAYLSGVIKSTQQRPF